MPYFITLLQGTHLKDSRKSTFSFLGFFYNFLWIYKGSPPICIYRKKTKPKNLNGPQPLGHCGGRPTSARNWAEGKSRADRQAPPVIHTPSRGELRRAVSRRRRLLRWNQVLLQWWGHDHAWRITWRPRRSARASKSRRRPKTYPVRVTKVEAQIKLSPPRNPGPVCLELVTQDAYRLRFWWSIYGWKAYLIRKPTQVVLCQNMFGINGNRRNKSPFRICQGAVSPSFGPIGHVSCRALSPSCGRPTPGRSQP
jgi:hypothetical protein